MRDRNALLNTNNSSTSNNDSYRSDSPFYNQSHQTYQLEEQNDDHLEGLSSKVKLLKDITLSIGQEARDSTLELGSMNDSFESTGTLLSGTMRRLKTMSKRQGGRCYMYTVFFFIIFWIFVITWLFRR